MQKLSQKRRQNAKTEPEKNVKMQKLNQKKRQNAKSDSKKTSKYKN